MHHTRAEIGELFDALRRAGMVRLDTARFRRKAHRQSNIELPKSAQRSLLSLNSLDITSELCNSNLRHGINH